MSGLHRFTGVTLLVMCMMAGTAVVHAQTGVQFDGTNDYITFGAAPGLGASTFTLELWFYRTGTGATASTGTGGITAVPLMTKGRGEADGDNRDMNYFLGIRGSDNVLVADYEEGAGQTSPGLNHPVAGVTPIRNNTWYHAAATFDGTTWRLYLNGNLEATLAVGASRLPQSASIQHAGLASALTSTGVAAGFFAGVIDEARVWNVARTTQEINDNMLLELASGTGLLGRWGLNEGTGTSAANSVVTGPNGTLTNGPTWTTGSPFALANSLKLGSNTAAHVAFGDPAALDLPQFTVETWFRRDGAGTSASTGAGGVTAIPLVTHGGAEQELSSVDMNFYLGIRASDNVLCADFEEGAAGSSPSLNHPIAGVTPIANGAWYHAAATYDGTTWRLYLNGALEATLAVNQPVASASTQHAGLGVMLTSTGAASGHFDGAFDEVRVWDYARSGAQINSAINTQINSVTTGLVARWALDEGAGTAVKASAGTTVNGTIQSTGWSWDGPAPFNAAPSSPPADPTGLVATGTTYRRIDLTWTDNANNETAFEIERSTTGSGGPYSLLASVASNLTTYADKGLVTNTEYCYRVRATNLSGPSNWTTASCATTPIESDHAVDFGGTNGYVTFGDPSQLDLAQFTLEVWFRRDGTGVTANTGTGGTLAIPLVTKGVGEAEASNVDMNYFLGIRGTDNVLVADFEEGATGASPGQNHLVAGTTPIANGVWHHVAATYDGTTWNLYLDGALEATLAVGQPVQSASIQHAALATAINSTGVNSGYFDGILDEVRIWNYARTLGQVRSTINAPIATATPGLVARWSLNEGAATDVDGSAGTVVNGVLVNANWTWTLETAPYNIVINDPPSVAVTRPNGGESFVVGTTESIQWNATDDVGVTSVDILLSRTGTAGPYETIASSAPNTGSFDWSVTGPYSGVAFIKVVARDGESQETADVSDAAFSIEVPIAVGMKLVEAKAADRGAVIRWETAFEADVKGFRVIRADERNGIYAPLFADLIAATGGLSGATYEYHDATIRPNHTYWYKLVEVTADGDGMEFGPHAVLFHLANNLEQNMPNPFNPATTIEYSVASDGQVSLVIFDVNGRRVRTLVDSHQRADVYRVTWDGVDDRGQRVASGVYFSRLVAGKFVETRKMSLLK